ncbi:MAG: acyl carrier protein [Alphaproteobacteria bacterium]|nr:acyl carrier protein [Alphaproteobacteria bacterium]TAD89142.1 MAG: acyl carrier protein [Alphaproteobacteria bacterium]
MVAATEAEAGVRGAEDVKNWMNLFRWIVKLIRDDYGIPEEKLTRTAVIETDIGLSIEQIEEVLSITAEAFQIRFVSGTLDELVKLEELCLLSAWLAGFYKEPSFLSASYVAAARGANARAGARE